MLSTIERIVIALCGANLLTLALLALITVVVGFSVIVWRLT